MAIRIDISTLKAEVNEVLETYSSWTMDNAFVHWFLQAFLVSDPDIAARSVTGVSHDKGVDAVFLDDSLGKVFVLQGKFHQGPKPPTEPRSDVIAFAQLARKLLGPTEEFRLYLTGIDPSVGRRMEEARTRIKTRKFDLHLYYVTTGKCSAALKSEAESEVAQAPGRAAISVLDRRDILSLLIDYLGGAAPPVPYLDLRIDSRGGAGSDGILQRYDSDTQIESWILTMSGRDVGDLYTTAGDRLFARNIRGFLGDTSINEGMRTTLRSDPGHFWYFNNGVTIVCDSARKTSERGQAILRVTNPQIINGQQTTRTLHQSSSRQSSVLMRVISIPREQSGSQERFERLVSRIVAATNWQNAIFPSDLRSNDARQVSLQRDLAKLRYHYLRKRQTKKEAKRSLPGQHGFWLKKDELAQVVAACELDPVVVRRGKEALFESPFYDKIFDGRAVRQYLSMYWTGRLVKSHSAGYPDRSYAKWHMAHFLWKRLEPILRSRGAADQYRKWSERNRWPQNVHRATEQVYLAYMEFFRRRRGKGPQAVDASHFFNRPQRNLEFESFWKGRKNKHRTRFAKGMKEFEVELRESLAK